VLAPLAKDWFASEKDARLVVLVATGRFHSGSSRHPWRGLRLGFQVNRENHGSDLP
jgi:hypothetical protein